jgi:hypothetical protein
MQDLLVALEPLIDRVIFNSTSHQLVEENQVPGSQGKQAKKKEKS